MKNIVAMVLAGGRVGELSVLTLFRPKSALPFGGNYRIIDFALSNLMNSEIDHVGILSQYRPASLIDHIGVGASWDFIGRRRGARILPPYRGESDSDWYKGTSDAVYQNLNFIRDRDPDYVLIVSGDHIYHMDYRDLFQLHKEREADLTIGFVKVPREGASRFGLAELAEDGKVLDYREKPPEPHADWASLTVYLFNTEALIERLNYNARHDSSYEFGRDIIPRMVNEDSVYGYRFSGYWGYSRTIQGYWQANMDLLDDNPKIDLERWGIRTNLDDRKFGDRPPAKFTASSNVQNSLISKGCIVGGEVENSILFPGVKIEPGARVKDSVIMHDCTIDRDAVLTRVICDKDVSIGPGCQLGSGPDHAPVAPEDEGALLASASTPFDNLVITRDSVSKHMDEPFTMDGESINIDYHSITVIGKGVKMKGKIVLGKNCVVFPEIMVDSISI